MTAYGITTFGVVDYTVFFVMITVSLGIGGYYGLRGNNTTEDFLMAGHNMSPFPVALSMIATYVSAISILGYVGEVYGNGIQLVWCLLGTVLGFATAIHIMLPILYDLKLSSVNEYLERRFRSPLVKKCALVQNTVAILLYLGLCLYAPTLALEAVTPYSSTTYIFVLGSVVTIYSSLGGLKAVVWTDAFQTILIIFGVVLAAVTSLVQAGGLGEAWRIASQSGRTEALDFSFGFFKRHTVFNATLKDFWTFMAMYSFSQSNLQRISVLKNYKSVKTVLWLNCLGIVSLVGLMFLTGLGIFAVYAGCDPLSLGDIARKDQVLPHYVMNHLGWIWGVPGLFVSCLFCGTMSSISSMLNCLPSMLWADVLSEMAFFKNSSERTRTLANKLITAGLGASMMGFAFLAGRMGGLIQATNTLFSVISGPTTGIFLLGTCVPICSKRGVLAGLTVSLVFMAWVTIGMQMHASSIAPLPLSVDQCPNATVTANATTEATTALLTSTLPTTPQPESPVPFMALYSISYTLLSPLGSTICILVGIVVSLLTGRENLEEVDPKLIIPCLRSFCGPSKSKEAELSTINGKPAYEKSATVT